MFFWSSMVLLLIFFKLHLTDSLELLAYSLLCSRTQHQISLYSVFLGLILLSAHRISEVLYYFFSFPYCCDRYSEDQKACCFVPETILFVNYCTCTCDLIFSTRSSALICLPWSSFNLFTNLIWSLLVIVIWKRFSLLLCWSVCQSICRNAVQPNKHFGSRMPYTFSSM